MMNCNEDFLSNRFRFFMMNFFHIVILSYVKHQFTWMTLEGYYRGFYKKIGFKKR